MFTLWRAQGAVMFHECERWKSHWLSALQKLTRGIDRIPVWRRERERGGGGGGELSQTVQPGPCNFWYCAIMPFKPTSHTVLSTLCVCVCARAHVCVCVCACECVYVRARADTVLVNRRTQWKCVADCPDFAREWDVTVEVMNWRGEGGGEGLSITLGKWNGDREDGGGKQKAFTYIKKTEWETNLNVDLCWHVRFQGVKGWIVMQTTGKMLSKVGVPGRAEQVVERRGGGGGGGAGASHPPEEGGAKLWENVRHTHTQTRTRTHTHTLTIYQYPCFPPFLLCCLPRFHWWEERVDGWGKGGGGGGTVKSPFLVQGPCKHTCWQMRRQGRSVLLLVVQVSLL